MATVHETLPGGSPAILIVERRLPVPDDLSSYVVGLGYRVHGASTKDEMEKILASQDIQMILLDIGVTGGEEASGGLQAANELAHARIGFAARGEAAALLVMEDEDRREALALALGERGVEVEIAASCADALRRGTGVEFDAVIVDGALRGGWALDLCSRLSAMGSPPVLVLAPNRDALERLLVLELGGDDCLDAGCSARELAARVRASRRRVDWAITAARGRLPAYRFSGWTLDLKTRRLTAPGGSSVVPPELLLNALVAFLEKPNAFLSVEDLQARASGSDSAGAGTNDWRVRIYRLRRLMRRLDPGCNLIINSSGRGYGLRSDVELQYG